MKRIQLFRSMTIATALTALITGCNNTDELSSVQQPELQEEKIVLTASSTPQTKVSYGEGEGELRVFWKTGDAFRLYSGETIPTEKFTLVEADNGKTTGKFEGTAAASTFNAFFPAQEGNKSWSALNVSYEGQEQDGTNTTAHLAKYNYMMAKGIAVADNQPTEGFYFSHMGSVMQFDITLPDGYTPAKDGQPVEITLTAPGMTKSMKPSGGAGDKTESLSLKLKNIILSANAKSFTAYMMCAPFTVPANGSLKITLTCKATLADNTTETFYEFEKEFPAGQAYETGKRYKFENLGTTHAFTPRKTITIKGKAFNFVMVRGGIFQMGDPDGYSADQPVHWVKITNDYYISQTEITQAQWKAVMGDNPSYHDGSIDPFSPSKATPAGEVQENRPVEYVSWNDICINNSEDGYYNVCFLNQIKSVVPGTPTFNLPTEAQWEYAARGGHKVDPAYYIQWAGTNELAQLKKYAWYDTDDGGDANGTTHEVKGKLPNQLGLYDMSGNVLEWCRDKWVWGDSYPEAPDKSSPLVDPYVTTGDSYIFRGGSYTERTDLCKTGFRNSAQGYYRGQETGFRLILLP